MDRGQILTRVIDAGGKLTVRSALNPILWLCAIITPLAIFLSCWLAAPTPTWLIILMSLPAATAVFGFLFLLIFDRDKLQSEEYQLKKISLELMQQKGEPSPSAIDLSKVIETPQTPTIEYRGQ
ncbi:MAG TPA: hypothetical protein PLR20_05715 [Syntrophales bacterium]|nr:hypothetical protein [Syntrophales bacterium]HOX94504.1 hypothetical protein [Syntrophales bacterium]HPI57869.1 hypothetical protein [Syntrophales bacterium]HPN24527.1 hypothetical protein [Syntrophales bacterium]HQM28833.1 hypothetical protein [Syntrophales bacterium]